jgi:hypothetical protein
MALEFTYEITAIDEVEKKLYVTYRANGKPSVESATRIPWESETLEQVITHFAPIAYWESLDVPTTAETISVGQTGTITISDTPSVFVPEVQSALS